MPKFRRKKKPATTTPKPAAAYEAWPEIPQENKKFEEYYKAIIPEDEWETFMEVIKTPLPVAFRLTGNRSSAFELKKFMESMYFDKMDLELDGEKIQPPTPLSWYPDGLGYHFECSRKALRRSPELGDFHKFLVSETEVGNINRQEAVSMIPPLLLEAKPGHIVLDTCAAPGSKTAQLLEAVHTEDGFPSGVVVANDADYNRSYMLVHQAKRLASPCLMVTNHDAQHFPGIKLGKRNNLKFDRILCDVPCSGDGTIRKNRAIWKKWTVADGRGLHSLQLGILERAADMLKEDGRIVYSTCSLNPIENEAVVAGFLSKHPEFELIDCSDKLNGLVRKPGIDTWNVYGRRGIVTEMDAADTCLSETLFPPKNISEMNIDRCLRIYPHLQNTGGFFVAVLERKVKATTEPVLADKENEGNGWKGENESPFVFLQDSNPTIQECCDFYGIHKEFPRDLFVVRTENKEQDFASIYLVTKEAKLILTSMNASKIKLVNTGVKLFKKNGGENTSNCQYRLSSEGVQTILPVLSQSRQMEICYDDLVIFLKNEYPLFDSFSKPCSEALKALPTGSCLFRCKTNNQFLSNVVLPFYRANVSVSLLLSKKERTSLLYRLTGELMHEFTGMNKKD